jgi:two-component system, OmpR family, response regulator
MDKQKLIFLVDDDPIINLLIMKRFTSEGFLLDSFRYGEDCLKEIHRDPDLIILDYYFVSDNQEVMNGMEVFNRIKELKPHTPVIILSGQEKGEVVLELARKGINAYIIKDNFLIENLFASMREIFERDR